MTSKDRGKKDVVLKILKEVGQDGLTLEQIMELARRQGLEEEDTQRALEVLNTAGDIYRSSSGIYNLTG